MKGGEAHSREPGNSPRGELSGREPATGTPPVRQRTRDGYSPRGESSGREPATGPPFPCLFIFRTQDRRGNERGASCPCEPRDSPRGEFMFRILYSYIMFYRR